MKSAHTARLHMLEEAIVEDGRRLNEKAKKIKDVEIALAEKDKDLKRAEQKGNGGDRHQRRKKHSSTRGGRDVSRSRARRRKRSTRGRTPIRRKAPADQVPVPPACIPSCFVPSCMPFPPFEDWKGHPVSASSSFAGMQQCAL